MTQTIIDFVDVSLVYTKRKSLWGSKNIRVLRDVNFSLYKGEVLGLIGKNGAGKSSLLKLFIGVLKPDHGKVINHGVNVSLLALQAGFDYELTGRDNAILSLMLLGMPKNEAVSNLDSIHDFSGLGSFFYEPVKYYSTGMRARLGFSVAYCVGTDVILIDEVLGVGDREFRLKSENAIKNRMGGDSAFVIASHNINLIKSTCDPVLWLKDGAIEKIGKTRQVIHAYVNHT